MHPGRQKLSRLIHPPLFFSLDSSPLICSIACPHAGGAHLLGRVGVEHPMVAVRCHYCALIGQRCMQVPGPFFHAQGGAVLQAARGPPAPPRATRGRGGRLCQFWPLALSFCLLLCRRSSSPAACTFFFPLR